MSRRYTADEKLAALRRLDINGGQIVRTSKETGIPEKTLRAWRQKFGVVSEMRTLREELLGKSLDLISHMNQAIQEAPIHQRAAALNHMIDKILKLTEVLEEQTDDETPKIQTIQIEYVDAEGKTYEAPPWTKDDSE